jgi:hypothetical protein
MALAGLNPALADVPAALDRVPTNAGVIVTINDMEQVRSRVEDLAKSLKADFDKDVNNPINVTKKLLAAEGLDKHGSLAIVAMPGADGKVSFEEGEGPMVMVVPVKDYAAFVKAMGGEDAKGVASLRVDGKPAFSKDLGGGYAVIGPQKDAVESFTGKAGNLADHKASLGKAGQGIADKSDVMIISNVGVLKPQLQEGVDGMKAQMKNVGGMLPQGGEEAQAAADMMVAVADAFVRDAQTGIIGIGLGDTGLTLDFGAQFKEGTASAKLLSQPGKAPSLLSHVPSQPFLMALAADLSAPGIKQALKDMASSGAKVVDKKAVIDKKGADDKKGAEDKKGADDKKADPLNSWNDIIKCIDKIDGMATVVGASPAGLMGILANTSSFVSTSDPTGYIKAIREATTGMNGKTINGVKMTFDYKQEATEISGVKVDTWTGQINVDPNDPAAAQVQMMMPMLFGPNGMGGMAGPVPNGVVKTMSNNTPLFTLAVEAAKGEKGLAADEAIKDVQKHLPENRTVEAYLGSKQILDALNGLLGMMGAGADIKVPAKLAPIGLGAGTTSGGIDVRVYVPTEVIKTVAAAAESMQGDGGDGGDGDMNAPAEKPKNPRF